MSFQVHWACAHCSDRPPDGIDVLRANLIQCAKRMAASSGLPIDHCGPGALRASTVNLANIACGFFWGGLHFWPMILGTMPR